ncbi:MAG: lipid-A-disaccharide synthase [Litorivicinaceae bacterium]
MRVLVSATELSGDAIGAAVLSALSTRRALTLEGIGGPHLEALGQRSMSSLSRLAVMGFWEVLPRLPELLWIRNRLAKRARTWRPDVLITCDSPDFNLPLARTVKALGIPVVHIASPSVWAWRRERIPSIAAALDHLLCLFPFEPALYQGTHLATTYIGHPLASQIQFNPDVSAVRGRLQVPDGCRVLACLPGSRRSEVAARWPVFLAGVIALKDVIPALHVVVPVASPSLRSLINPGPHRDWIQTVDGQARDVLAAADACLVASGTASLESVLTGRPTVIAYRLHPSTYRRVMPKLLTPWISLPNQLVGRQWIPELIQEHLTVASIVEALQPRLSGPTDPAFLETARGLHQTLSTVPIARAVDAIEVTVSHVHRH